MYIGCSIYVYTDAHAHKFCSPLRIRQENFEPLEIAVCIEELKTFYCCGVVC